MTAAQIAYAHIGATEQPHARALVLLESKINRIHIVAEVSERRDTDNAPYFRAPPVQKRTQAELA